MSQIEYVLVMVNRAAGLKNEGSVHLNDAILQDKNEVLFWD